MSTILSQDRNLVRGSVRFILWVEAELVTQPALSFCSAHCGLAWLNKHLFELGASPVYIEQNYLACDLISRLFSPFNRLLKSLDMTGWSLLSRMFTVSYTVLLYSGFGYRTTPLPIPVSFSASLEFKFPNIVSQDAGQPNYQKALSTGCLVGGMSQSGFPSLDTFARVPHWWCIVIAVSGPTSNGAQQHC